MEEIKSGIGFMKSVTERKIEDLTSIEDYAKKMPSTKHPIRRSIVFCLLESPMDDNELYAKAKSNMERKGERGLTTKGYNSHVMVLKREGIIKKKDDLNHLDPDMPDQFRNVIKYSEENDIGKNQYHAINALFQV